MFWKSLAVHIRHSDTGDTVTACCSVGRCLTSSPHRQNAAAEWSLLSACWIVSLSPPAAGRRLHQQRAEPGTEVAAWARTERWSVGLDSGQQLLKSCVQQQMKGPKDYLWYVVFLSLGCLSRHMIQMNEFFVIIKYWSLFNWSYHQAANRKHKSFYYMLS